jgi:ATP-dependent DNA helicase DinG
VPNSKTTAKTPRKTGKAVPKPIIVSPSEAGSTPATESLALAGAGRDLSASVATVFQPKGILARALPQSQEGEERAWEDRPEQREMAAAVASAIENKNHLLVEAGTGVGKSYAYLIPFILWAINNRKRVLIATHTKALQQQLNERDLPFLRKLFKEKMGLDLRFELCLGTQNYLCPRRLAKNEAVGLFATASDAAELREISAWAEKTKTGRSLDLPFEPTPHIWSQVNRESDLCLGRACPMYEDSFFYIARRKQENAHVLIANHHLLFAHLAAGGNESRAVLPSFDGLVIDEAHQAEDVAAAYLGLEVSNLSIAKLIELLHHRRTNKTILSGSSLPERDALEEKLIAAAEEAREATGRFFENLQIATRVDVSRSQSLRLREAGVIENSLEEPLLRLEDVLRAARKSAEKTVDEELQRELEGYTTRCFDLRSNITTLLNHSFPNWVYWLACQTRAGNSFAQRSTPRVPRLSLHGAPIDVAQAMQESLFGKICPVVLTSATLTTGANFEFLRERLGLTPEQSEREVETLSLGSPFDYQNNALIYVARDLPDPYQASAFEDAAIQRASGVLQATRGRAFVLCTSFRMVDATAKFLRDSLPKNIQILKQGEMARGKLLDTFRKDVSSVLVGTTSFWQGVDVPGESLSCVVIMKLPFAVPDDPMVQARVESLKERGRDAFNEYQVPQAVMMFRQGFGRLIRTATDRGIVAILDPRVSTKKYGKTFLQSLPDCTITDDLELLREFVEADS